MHVILADSIDGGVLMILLIGGCLVSSVLALIALVPAWQGDRSATLTLAGPAFIGGMVAMLYGAWCYVHYGMVDPNYGLMVYWGLWMILAGPPLATSLLAGFCLWFRRSRVKQSVGG